MRRRDREIRDREEIDAIIRGCVVCHVAFAVKNEPYLVPLSFGYDGGSLYFHTAGTGRKLDCIAANNRVCFQLERDVRLVEHPERACEWTFSFESVVGYGVIHELESDVERARGLNEIMKHYSGRDWPFGPADMAGTRVWQLEIESITGKRAVPK